MTRQKPLLLCILDGWGLNPLRENNAIALAETPHFDRLWQDYPHTTLRADGLMVGLPEGQFGNSEVGHMNIGAGRIVMQDLPRITQAIDNNTMAQNPELLQFIAAMKQSGGTAHVMGLVSSGGVHGHQDHIAATIRILHSHAIPITVHVFTDGRDTAPQSALEFIDKFLGDIPAGIWIGTVSGRFYAMDRDNRWERVVLAWQAVTMGQGLSAPDAREAITNAYARKEHDEFIVPTVIGDYAGMAPQDGIFMTNFRSDRVRELLGALLLPDFDHFDRGQYEYRRPALGMVEYTRELRSMMRTIFPPQNMTDLLGDVVSRAGLTQLRSAETEKYPHVTFFFNGGVEVPYPGEERLVLPSPKVATYDLQPEMSAIPLTEQLVHEIRSGRHDFIVLNYANPDMVGHTGSIPATIKAVETVDACLGQLYEAVKHQGGILMVIADHGNADQMVDPITGEPYTAHTLNPVPCIIAGAKDVRVLKTDGKLGDVAPTILHLLDVPQPEAMTGVALIADAL